MTSADQFQLTDVQRRDLTALTRAGRTEQRLVQRAAIVLGCLAGPPEHGDRVVAGVCEDTVRKWRRRWRAAPGVESLRDAPRSGRRPVFTAVQTPR